MQLERLTTIFQPADPPRAGVIRVLVPPGHRPDDGLGELDDVVVASVHDSVAVTRAVPTVSLPIAEAIPLLAAVGRDAGVGRAVAFHAAVVEAALQMVARGRILPGVSPTGVDVWRAGPFDTDDVERVRALAAAMPASARAAPVDPAADELVLADAEGLVRALFDAVADVLPRTPAARWLTGDDRFAANRATAADPALREWARQVSAGVDSGLRLALRLEVPSGDLATGAFRAVVRLRNLADPTQVTDAEVLWSGGEQRFGSHATFDAMLAVRRAAQVWPPLETLLADGEPIGLDLLDDDVTDLLDGAEGRLAAAGIDIEWPLELSRDLGSRALVSLPGRRPDDVAAFLRSAPAVPVVWQLTLACNPLTEAETELVALARPVLWLRDRWVVVPPELARRARERALPPLPPYDALGVALAGEVEIAGIRERAAADGWIRAVADLISDPGGGPEELDTPADLDAVLREYQQRGLRWLDRMVSLGFGGCLADDMGLGKTIMVIALHLRHRAHPDGAEPILVICPTSVLGNWEREIERFAPGTPVRRFHGATRSLDDKSGLGKGGVVLTTYATMRSDPGPLARQRWGMVVADEAQHVKNRLSGTARALRGIPGGARLALTGTPVENNLAELWAILDWTTPGLLGRIGDFRTRWSRPIEVDRDGPTADRLARLVHPFLLRRRKSDPGVAPELPPKTLSDHLVSLTGEQVSLYQDVVRETMAEIRVSATPIARRGRVLKLLVALKQVCNHPAHFLREGGNPDASRSEKLQLLDELVDTVVAENGAVLVFTQYVRMARLLSRHLTDRGVSSQLLHGGVPVEARDKMVRRFQAGEVPVFLLSLKAGGTGLTLTRADHVIHFDRWWNPAVEDQATDRAHRIGQTRPVQVHRLIVRNTLEERIADLLESKQALADAVLTGGEGALSELTDTELRALVELGTT